MTVNGTSLSENVEASIIEYLISTETSLLTNFYAQVIKEAEIGMLKATMAYWKGNQSDATEILGVSRATLRKKLTEHSLLYYGKELSRPLTRSSVS